MPSPLLSLLLAAALSAGQALAAAEPVQFNRDVRPILSDHCFACHGFDAKKRQADLRLDQPDGPGGALVPTKEGRFPIKPGDPSASELWLRITSSDPEELMPPPKSHKTLSPAHRETLRRWIEQGAPYQRHWAFEPLPASPHPPTATPGDQPLDAFVLARLHQEGLAPSPPADPTTLVRRVTLALTGLPPSLAEIDAFLQDPHPDAYERLVDRLLASPRFGEQMARNWLDVARYGDTHGLHLDNERSMWPYRDWVVQAFNRNLPFDQFTIEQLAGDLLPNPTQDQLVATGFSRCNVTTGEGGSIDAEQTFRYAVDRTATAMQTWMGLTGGCAVCHDHKFDPLSQKEFYSLYAFFYSAADPANDGNTLITAPSVQLKSPQDEAQLAALAAQAETQEKERRELILALPYQDPATQDPLPAAQHLETVWVDDSGPSGADFKASPGHPTHWITSDVGPVHRGQRALRRQGVGLTQDVYEGHPTPPLAIPPGARLFAHVYLDPADLPRSIMLQYSRGGWEHRAVWGDPEAIAWGAAQSTERAAMGPLPPAGQWVRLEFPADQVGLKSGDSLDGLAFTQFGGTVIWDHCGVLATIDPARDPATSLSAWIAQASQGDPPAALPEAERALLKKPAASRTAEDLQLLRSHYLLHINQNAQTVGQALATSAAALRKQRDDLQASFPGSFIMKDLDPPRQAHVMKRGAYDQPGDPVSRGVPAMLPPLKVAPGTTPTRLDLARWLVAPEHPLTARVTVNRFWQQFFGVGLVKTSGDFGSQGDAPSHPELLDWLAATFRQSGWNVKSLARLLVTSATWRQSSALADPSADLSSDPLNRLLARAPRLRLEAEEIRDQALAASGLLNLTMGGRGVRPYQPPNIWEPVGFTGSNTANYTPDQGPALYRRSLYTFLKRTAPPPFMTNFDAPSREQICAGRERSNTPLQALQLMNDVQHFEAARVLAERTLTAGGPTLPERLTFCFRTVTGRWPLPQEAALLEQNLARQRRAFDSAPAEAAQVLAAGQAPPHPGLPPAEVAAWTLLANLLFNLDDALTRN